MRLLSDAAREGMREGRRGRGREGRRVVGKGEGVEQRGEKRTKKKTTVKKGQDQPLSEIRSTIRNCLAR